VVTPELQQSEEEEEEEEEDRSVRATRRRRRTSEKEKLVADEPDEDEEDYNLSSDFEEEEEEEENELPRKSPIKAVSQRTRNKKKNAVAVVRYTKEEDSEREEDETEVAVKSTTGNKSKKRAKKVKIATTNSSSSSSSSSSPRKKRRNSNKANTKQNRTCARSRGFDTDDNLSPNSVAMRGLPQGSRAIAAASGFEIRSLDGIPPLLTPTLVGKALEMVASGEHSAAARLLWIPDHQHDSIQVFCREACQRLGIKPRPGISLVGGGAGSRPLLDRAMERLEQGTVSPDADLPGRLLVVRAGTTMNFDDNDERIKEEEEEEEEYGGEPPCPPELEGCIFESAAELHAHTKERLATYANMQVTFENAFCPWQVMMQRLETAQLLPSVSSESSSSSSPPQQMYSNNKCPFVVTIVWEGGESLPKGSWQMYRHGMLMNSSTNINNDGGDGDDDEGGSNTKMQWALIEGATREAPPVILGVSPNLLHPPATTTSSAINDVATDDTNALESKNRYNDTYNSSSSYNKVYGILPKLSAEVAQVRLPASLLQKAVRRNFCSPAPVLEACQSLLYGVPLSPLGDDAGDKDDILSTHTAINKDKNELAPPRGGVFAMLSTTWKCMLEDASPFDAPDNGSLLGLEELLLLSLVAKADDSWQMPPRLLCKAVATALRTQQQPANLANVEKTVHISQVTWNLQEEENSSSSCERRAVQLRNALLVMRAAVGCKTVHRTSLEKATPIQEHELELVTNVFNNNSKQQGKASSLLPMISNNHNSEEATRLQNLDKECRLAAYDAYVAPASLLVLQATLPSPPMAWKKYSLPAIARQVQKLVTEVNARMPDHHRLVRLSAWGYNNATTTDSLGSSSNVSSSAGTDTTTTQEESHYMSAREVATMTGELSNKEHEIIDCFETVQRWRTQQERREEQLLMKEKESLLEGANNAGELASSHGGFIRAKVGSQPSAHDGRMAFLLAFAKAEEIEVCPTAGGATEVVNVLFCGDREEPLLVQRIGKARQQAEAAMQGPEAGSSGAKAVPSLGYVQRSRSERDRLLVEAAERAVAESWKHGRTVALPLPPPGIQWNLLSKAGQEEEAEQAVKLTAELSNNGHWEFSIGGIRVEPFDARKVISPCSLDTHNHKPVALGSEREELLKLALYHKEDSDPISVLRALTSLHELAVEARKSGANEGMVYDWLLLATRGKLSPPIWRDAILALKTREKDDVVLGPVLADGTCKRDMTEGCILRIYYVLESLYPTVLIKNGALKWRVRQRGAGYHHMLGCLELLSRGVGEEVARKAPAVTALGTTVVSSKPKNSRKDLSRRAAAKCKASLALMAEKDDNCMNDDDGSDVETGESDNEDYLPLPKVTTELWPHQEASVAKVVSGVKEGRRGHADASAVGAGKTLTALATVVRLAAYMEVSHGKRNGVLVMLPTKALVKEWLLQIATHTSGFQVVEQREDGQLFSLTYGRSGPPIDGNTIVISTLDRVREHPFKHQAAWDFVAIDECLAVQNADAKRWVYFPSRIGFFSIAVLMLILISF
jgi:hypothetical protein